MILSNLRVDAAIYIQHEPTWARKIAVLLFNLGFHAVVGYRLSSWLCRLGLWPLAYVLSYFFSVWTGSQISARAVIGPGLVILHPYGVVIAATTVIGSHCLLAGRNTFGQRGFDGLRPVVGTNFRAGPGANVLGHVIIGNRVTLGANVTITRDIGDDQTVVCAEPELRPRCHVKTESVASVTPDTELVEEAVEALTPGLLGQIVA